MTPASRYRAELPQLGDELFLTDGGIETTLIFHRGLDLPEFAAFDLLKNDDGMDELRRYFVPYLELAKEHGAGFVLESSDLAREPEMGGGDRLRPGGAGRDESEGDRTDG